MGLIKFGLYFAIYLLVGIFLQDFVQNKFLIGFIFACWLTVMTIRGDS